MERASLQQIADILDTLESGRWLQQQLTEYAAPTSHPHVLMLISTSRDLAQLFPAGPQIAPSWQIWKADDELSLPVLEQTDLIIWVMTAMRLFPGEYQLALEQARQQTIPIWAIITGIERLSDEATFLHRRLPQYRASLPEGSQLLLVRPDMRVPIHETIIQLLAKEGTHLCQQGNNRRLQTVRIRLKAELQKEQQTIANRLQKAEQFAETAQAGLSSLKILTGAAASTVLAEYQSLRLVLEELKELLLEKTALEGVHEPLEMLPEVFSTSVSTWKQESFLPLLREKHANAYAHLQTWYRDYTGEVTEFFRFSESLHNSSQPPEVPWPEEKVLLYLNQLEAVIVKSIERFSHTLHYSIQHVTLPVFLLPETHIVTEEEPPLAALNQPYKPYEASEMNQPYEDQSYKLSEHGSLDTPHRHEEASRNIPLSQRIAHLIDGSRRLLHELNDPAYDHQQKRKEVLQKLVYEHCEWLVEDFLSVLQQRKKLLIQLLEGIQQTQGEQRLEHIQPTLKSPQEQLTLLARAERLLRSNA